MQVRYEVRNRRWESEMVEQTLTAHARAEARRICGAENFFPTLIYFELEEYCGALPIEVRSSLITEGSRRSTPDTFAVAGW
jgi:hypothetical protein